MISDRIETITAFRTSDGKTFDTIQAAEAHAARLALSNLMKEQCICRGGEWDAGMVETALLERAAEYRDIFIAICGGVDE